MVNSTKSQIRKTTNLVTGIVGLSVGSSMAAGLPGMAGTIVRGGALPMAGLGLMAEAAPSGNFGSVPRQRKAHHKKRSLL